MSTFASSIRNSSEHEASGIPDTSLIIAPKVHSDHRSIDLAIRHSNQDTYLRSLTSLFRLGLGYNRKPNIFQVY
jgi:hypothetical protein